ncbi:AMP-binding protein [Granulosicoccus sp.]|nr:AMP-binding protein [Granulosicoccus sp.]MDB4222527.1 AMP-binding protein [Granulosicoccus sp.]
MPNNNKSVDQLEAEQLSRLARIVGTEHKLESLSDLAKLPVLRKDELLKSQLSDPPFGMLKPAKIANIYQSPGPIYEPCLPGADPWRFGKFVRAIGIKRGDIVQNTFSYHFTPAGAMFETAARAVEATVFPAGPGQTRQQCEVAQAIKTTVYAGTPDFLNIILTKADEEGFDLSSIKRAAVSAGPLFPQLRQSYLDRGIVCRQCYGTADVGLIAYESEECIDGMFVDDDVIVEIVSPGTAEPLPAGEIGEVVVTVLNESHPVVRFSVGDLSAFMSETGDTQKRIVGWRGRADQATKVKGMFIRPEQISAMVDRHAQINRARVEVSFDGSAEWIDVMIESNMKGAEQFENIVRETLKLKTRVTVVNDGDLPRDGILVSDMRDNIAG